MHHLQSLLLVCWDHSRQRSTCVLIWRDHVAPRLSIFERVAVQWQWFIDQVRLHQLHCLLCGALGRQCNRRHGSLVAHILLDETVDHFDHGRASRFGRCGLERVLQQSGDHGIALAANSLRCVRVCIKVVGKHVGWPQLALGHALVLADVHARDTAMTDAYRVNTAPRASEPLAHVFDRALVTDNVATQLARTIRNDREQRPHFGTESERMDDLETLGSTITWKPRRRRRRILSNELDICVIFSRRLLIIRCAEPLPRTRALNLLRDRFLVSSESKAHSAYMRSRVRRPLGSSSNENPTSTQPERCVRVQPLYWSLKRSSGCRESNIRVNYVFFLALGCS